MVLECRNGIVMPTDLPKEERQKIRSKTFPGIAEAIAEQWGSLK